MLVKTGLKILVLVVFFFSFPSVESKSGNKSENLKVVDWNTEKSKSYLFFTIFVLIVSLGKLCYHKFTYISSYFPESFLLIAFGIVAGCIIKYGLNNADVAKLTPELFFLVLLPPIVLDSAYHMYNRTFGEILGIVIIFAVLGTIFSFLIIAFSLYGLEEVGGMGSIKPTGSNLMAILLFSSLIVAVDPVAVLAIFKDLGVDKELYYMIFGESLLNDAVTIVLYEIIQEFLILGKEGITPVNILLGIASFFTVSLGGLLIGSLVGIGSSILSRFQSNGNIHCVLLIISAYISYIVAYSLKWSGIISIISCGIIQAAYAFKNICKNSQVTLKNFIDLSAGVSEAIIFVFLGLELFLEKLVWNVAFQIFTIVLCIVSRFLVILVLRICINYVKVDQRKISWTELFVATYGGLRGAVAFSLVILIDPITICKYSECDGEYVRNLFITTTLIIIIFTVSFMGITMKPLVKFLSIKSEKEKLISLYSELNCAVIDNLMTGMEVLIGQKGRNQFRSKIAHFDDHFVRPLLLNDPYNNYTFKLIKRYEQVSLALHYAGLYNTIDEAQLCDIPKALWPKPQNTSESVEEVERDLIHTMRKVSKLVKTTSIQPTTNKNEYPSLLERTLNNRLKDVARRKSTVCNKVILPEGIINFVPFENQWKIVVQDDFSAKDIPKLSSVSCRVNPGFIPDEEIQMHNIHKSTEM